MQAIAKCVLACVLLVPATLATAADLAVKNGDVIVFLGDALTEEYQARSGDRVSYPTHVESYLTVRYPDVSAEYYNVSMPTATASSTLSRFDRDIAPLKPTIAVICLGLQDAGIQAFKPALLDEHKAAMTELIQRLKKLNCRVYVLSPPSVDEQRQANLRQLKINDTLAKYATAQREIAEAQGAVYADWFDASMTARDAALKTEPNFAFAPEGINHTQRSLTFGATILLEALGAEPTVVDIVLDWNTGKTQCNVGDAHGTIDDAGARVIDLKDTPLPWPSLVSLSNAYAGDWEAMSWCQYMLTVENAPELGLLMRQGDREVPVITQQLVQGLNLASIEPLRSLEAARQLTNLIRRKNYTRVHAWRDQVLKPVAEPELVDAQKALIQAWYKYVEGYRLMIQHAPKTFDLQMTLSELSLPSLEGNNAAASPAPTPKEK